MRTGLVVVLDELAEHSSEVPFIQHDDVVEAFPTECSDQALRNGVGMRARAIGIETVLTPVHAPQANALAERVIETTHRECLDHLIVLNEAHLRRVLREYGTYYNDARPHRSLDLEPPSGPRQQAPPSGRARVVGAPLLGGLHHVYDWAA